MLKKIIKLFLPPIIPIVIERMRTYLTKEVLFGGHDALFKKAFVKESVYAEYGCGASTIWVANNIDCKIFSVDSSAGWIGQVKKECKSLKPILHLADVGPVGDWGMPIDYEKSDNFTDYTDWIWTDNKKPNIILIDGRFRVCCFLTCLINGEKGTKIFFDDYTNRPMYHFVEKFLKPTETCGRQALFVIPERELLDIGAI